MKNPLKPTLTELINYAGNIPAPLVRAVVKQLGGRQEFTERAQDITNHGISGGFSGFIYYSDTVPFARKHKASILKMAEEQAADFGEDLYTMISSFNCLTDHRTRKPEYTTGQIAAIIHGRFTDSEGDHTQVFNALAWYAAEEVARAYCDLLEG